MKKKNSILKLTFTSFFIILNFLYGCKKENNYNENKTEIYMFQQKSFNNFEPGEIFTTDDGFICWINPEVWSNEMEVNGIFFGDIVLYGCYTIDSFTGKVHFICDPSETPNCGYIFYQATPTSVPTQIGLYLQDPAQVV
ncbi:MAG: hypothetical protein PHC83_06920 [Bacteroidales bacterium]|nr:hypothetical protein [Bacteroidales bacterium]MDD3281285.1 hypothetical protein [Bacteroidales bacterium]MDD4209743.1 hypothetical protein [Bacteroidales bacterium]